MHQALIASKDVGGIAHARAILRAASRESGYSIEELIGPSRLGGLVWVRHVAITAIRRGSRLSLKQIGTLFGNRDHTSIHYAVHRIERESRRRPEVAQLLQEWSNG